MSNLIQETDQEMMKHMCKLCDKSFPSGRSLGCHMRSHVINATDHHNHGDDQQNKKKRQMKKLSSVNNGEKPMNSSELGYELRKDPKKTPKVKDSCEVENSLVVLDKLCKECGKGFQSWKALFGHMKCHSEKVLSNKVLNQETWTSQSDNENSGKKAGQIKKSRSRRAKRYIVTSAITTTITIVSSSISMNVNDNNNNNQISSNHASTSVVSEIEQDQESEVAMCLMMLSRDEGKWGSEIESNDNCNSSAFVKLSKVKGKKVIGNGSKNKKSVDNVIGRSEEGSTGLEKVLIQNDECDDEFELGFGKFEDSNKRKFDCITCNKSFHSYQALGGHKASHKKLKGNLDQQTEDENTNANNPGSSHELMIDGLDAKPDNYDQTTKSINLAVGSLKKAVVLGTHECPLCLKVFSSGQALGGHKRSHMIAEAKLLNQKQTSMNLIDKVNEPVREIRGFLDLNMLPDTMEEDMIINSSTTVYKPWHWADTANHEPTTLLGLLSTS